MGCWKGATFKEDIWEELTCYSAGMSTNMKRNFKFVNVLDNAYHNVTFTCLETDYNINGATTTAPLGNLALFVLAYTFRMTPGYDFYANLVNSNI
jgi:hypothetical protein